MSEMKLDQLFQKAREEAPTTSIQQVQKWIGYSAFLLLMIGLLGKFKVLTLKGNAMYASIIGAVGLTAIALVYSNSSTDVVEEQQPSQLIQTILPFESAVTELKIEPEEPLKEVTDKLIQPFVIPMLPINVMELKPIQFSSILVPVQLESTKSQEQLEFKKIVAKGVFTLIIQEGKENSYRTVGDYNNEALIVKIDDVKKELLVEYDFKKKKKKKRGKFVDDTNDNSLTMYVTVKDLKDLDISGIVEVQYVGTTILSKLEVKMDGISSLNIKSDIADLTTRLTGISKFTVNGILNKMNGDLSGISEFSSTKLGVMEYCKLKLSGASKADIEMETGYLNVNISGGCNFNVKGTAKKADIILSGASSVKGKQLKVLDLYTEVEGTSILDIFCSQNATIIGSGASSVVLSGNPYQSHEKLSGKASVKRK